MSKPYLSHNTTLYRNQYYNLINIYIFIGWWVVLFTGRFPQSMFDFIVGQLRWSTRVSIYMNYMTDVYPAFTGNELPEEK